MTSTFEEIWNGIALQGIRAEHFGARRSTAQQFHHCSWCYKEKYVDFEYQFDERMRDYIVMAPVGTSEERSIL